MGHTDTNEVPYFVTPLHAHFLAHRLGQLEYAYRQTAQQLLPLLSPEDDLTASVVRVLSALDG